LRRVTSSAGDDGVEQVVQAGRAQQDAGGDGVRAGEHPGRDPSGERGQDVVDARVGLDALRLDGQGGVEGVDLVPARTGSGQVGEDRRRRG
jgi:hypothetical protein